MKTRSIICPVSDKKVNNPTVRATGFLMAVLTGLYLATGSLVFIILLLLDFFIRSFPNASYSPFSYIADKAVGLMKAEKHLIDKAQKVFAARVGLLFSLTMLIFHFMNPAVSIIAGSALLAFALLESFFNICVGCMVYSYFVYPFYMGNSPKGNQ